MPPASPPQSYATLVKIGSGATATVHVALERASGALVALKRLHPHLADDPRDRQALVDEARMLSLVAHRNVVALREVITEGETVALVLEYVDGVTLGRLLVALAERGEKLPTSVALRILRDACGGLSAVHEAESEGVRLGLVHRDVSPQNLLIGRDGITRLSDFGTAKLLFDARTATTEGTLKGKLGYMAPEYVAGKPAGIESDLFAMGVVAWETLSGKRLFRGMNEGETLDKVLRMAAPRLDDAELGDAVESALEKDPRSRVASANALESKLAKAGERHGTATYEEVAAFLRPIVGKELDARDQDIRAHLEKRSEPSSPQQATDLVPAGTRRPWLAVLAFGASLALVISTFFFMGTDERSFARARVRPVVLLEASRALMSTRVASEREDLTRVASPRESISAAPSSEAPRPLARPSTAPTTLRPPPNPY